MVQKTILVVEDNPTMSEGICDILEMEGYRVLSACNGVEGLSSLEKGNVDLILADIMMPLMDGYALYQKVREHPEWTAIPFVFLTARAQKEDVRFGKGLGADDYLVKPIDPADLVVVVEAKLRRAEEMQQAAAHDLEGLKRNILNALSHEFRTPLTYIQGYTDLLLEGDMADEPELFKDFLTRIQVGSQRIHRLVEDFIFLVAIESGEATQAISEAGSIVDLIPMLRAKTSTFQAETDDKGITLHADWPAALPGVFGYTAYLGDAFSRLLDNAIKFSPDEGGEIWAGATVTDDRVRISVRDNGIGIPEEEQARIFDRFYQVDRQFYEQQGVGLGLPIARSIVELHGGEIKVESKPGEGSTFTIVLPVA